MIAYIVPGAVECGDCGKIMMCEKAGTGVYVVSCLNSECSAYDQGWKLPAQEIELSMVPL